jgi:cell division septum initiation protein DivIVA
VNERIARQHNAINALVGVYADMLQDLVKENERLQARIDELEKEKPECPDK